MIELSNVSKRYGKVCAIDNLSLYIHEAQICCLLGRNGAGKTTLMKMINGSIAKSSGRILINGNEVTTINMPENIRYIEAAKKQFNFKISELIKLATELDPMFDSEFAALMINKFGLPSNKKYNSLSFGMKTMVTTMLSLSSNADIILLDEPVLGFDAITRKEFYDLLQMSFEAHPRIIIVSTHLIDEIANIASQIIMIDKGRVIMNEDINTILEKSYKISGISEKVETAIKDINVISKDIIGKYSTAYVFDRRILEYDDIQIENMSVETLFIKMLGEKNNE